MRRVFWTDNFWFVLGGFLPENDSFIGYSFFCLFPPHNVFLSTYILKCYASDPNCWPLWQNAYLTFSSFLFPLNVHEFIRYMNQNCDKKQPKIFSCTWVWHAVCMCSVHRQSLILVCCTNEKHFSRWKIELNVCKMNIWVVGIDFRSKRKTEQQNIHHPLIWNNLMNIDCRRYKR